MIRNFIAAIAASVALFGAFDAQAACAGGGGDASCIGAMPTSDWQHELCLDSGAYIYMDRGWCEVRNGTWNGGGGGIPPHCEGAIESITGSNVLGLASAMTAWIHGPTCGNGPPPPGCSNFYCMCNTAFQYGVQTRDYAEINMSGASMSNNGVCDGQWSDKFVHIKTREVGCPPGWGLGSGDEMMPCVKYAPCLTCVGNPVDVGNGAKMQREVDYASPAPGGLVFARYYNSSGYFDLTPRYMEGTDVWRHTYSTRVVPYVGNAYVMAMVQHADGNIRPFNLSGVEIQNFDGGAHKLEMEFPRFSGQLA